MLVSGKIIILINDDLEFGEKMQYGFVKVKGIEEDVDFEELKIGDKVNIFVKETSQGLLAESLTLSSCQAQPEASPSPPASL